MEMIQINKPNYKKVQQTAYSILETHPYFFNMSFPISPIDIIQNVPNIKLETYSNLAVLTESSNDEIAEMLDSEEGSTFFDPTQNRYVIAFNENRNEHRIRFTLAHELGHIYLGHLLENAPDDLYKIQETEANYFAKRLLVPQPFICKALEITDLQTLNTSDISILFNVSMEVAGYSINNYNCLPFTPRNDEMCKPFIKGINRQMTILQMAHRISPSA
ncbi:ImmA/IrrE family metallo-endopeptidase [Lactobacillus xujianguonis]|uniref:ImmA/IrrE family metallo-endopeptidase n=1 Tax=Lactobacillus xujianguonis TaxID=2495899 RepID=A0A437SY04_9LACO|nr:ImmA/IrrE family metallo-endopeptidase [Lactobacillus xujianguonis]RVU71814.1 ImmA/IrrE family metallo-endopeptidase [Lactobacillus xujianguonis]